MGNGSSRYGLKHEKCCGPLPIMSALLAPDSRPLTLRREISQGIARRRGGNLGGAQKEKSATATPLPLLSKATAL
jgi:hypothetical protein